MINIYAACTCAAVLIYIGPSEAGGERPNPIPDCKGFDVIKVKINAAPGKLILKCSDPSRLTWILEDSSSSKFFRVASKSGGLQVYLKASLDMSNKPDLKIKINGLDGAGNVQRSVKFDIQLEGPIEKEIKLYTDPPNSLFENGTKVVITCEADQFFDPSFTWAVSGRDVTLGLTDRFRVNYTTRGSKSIGMFEFNPILHRDAGTFVCILTGTAGRVRIRQERTLGLHVVSKPHVVARPPSVYIRGDTAVNLTCVQDDPPGTEVEMRWYRIIDGRRSRVSVSKGLVSREVYTVQGLGGDAEYVCEGFNSMGQDYSNVVKVHQLTQGTSTCPQETDQSGIIWPETPTGESSVSDCPSKLQGTSSRRCSLFGQWDDADYDTSCRQIILDSVLRNATQAKDGVLEGSFGDILAEIETAQDTDLLTSNDIGVILEVLEIIAEGYIHGDGELNVEPDDIKKMATVVNTALSAGLEKWKKVIDETKRGPKSLLWSVDTILKLAIQRAEIQGSPEPAFDLTISTDNIYLQIGSVLNETVSFPQSEVNSLSWVTETRTGARMMQESFQATRQGRTWYSGIVYRSISALMQEQVLENVTMEAKSLVSEDIAAMSEMSENPPKGDVVSRVMSFNVYPKPDSLNPQLYLSMEVSRMNSRPVCSFLDYSQSQRFSRTGVWATKGCFEMSRDDDVVVCSCNHTTNFAILMSPVDTEIGEHVYVLELISIVGCCISLFFLLLTIILYSMVWRYMVKTQVSRIKSILLMHLCATLIISYTLFLAGANSTDNKDVCTAVAALLHYFFLVVFFVMLAQGIQLFISIVIVINFTSYLKSLLVTIWVPPAIIVGITLGTVKLDGYRGQKYCWLSTERHIIWAFVGPALFIIVVNTFILVLSVRKMLTRKTWDENILSQGKYLARALGVMLPIIGITWVLGVFYINRDVVVFQYLFAICNSLQGLFIFIFHCCTTNVTNSFKEMRSRFKRNSLSKSTLRSKSQITINSLTSKSIKSYKSNYTLSLTTAALRTDRDGIDKQEFLSNGIANSRQGFQFARTIALPSVFDQSLETPTEHLIHGDARSDQGSGSPTSAQHVNMGFTDNVRRRPRVSFSVDYAEEIGFQEDFESSPDPAEGRKRIHQHNLSMEDVPESDIERALRLRRRPIDQVYKVVNAFNDRRTTVKEDRSNPPTARGRWRSAYDAIRRAKTFRITSSDGGRDGTSQYS